VGELDDIANSIRLPLDVTIVRLGQDGRQAIDLVNLVAA
jgi:hypothetical protein